MGDGVQLNTNVTNGAIVDTEQVTRNAKFVQIQRIKQVIGNVDVDGGDVSPTNPLPVSEVNYSQVIVTSGNYTYIAKAIPGSSQSSAVWQAQCIYVNGNTTTTTWANGSALFNNVAINIAGLSYS